MNGDQDGQNRERELISFPRWAEVLAETPLSTGLREAYRSAIIAFLRYCKRRHAGASVILIQSYLTGLPDQERSGAREALRRWYRAAGNAAGGLKLEVEVEGRGTEGRERRTEWRQKVTKETEDGHR
jgi:hypothetical protein